MYEDARCPRRIRDHWAGWVEVGHLDVLRVHRITYYHGRLDSSLRSCLTESLMSHNGMSLGCSVRQILDFHMQVWI